MPQAESSKPDISELLNKRMTAGEAAAIITAAPVQVTGLMLPLKDWLNSPYVTIDYAGVPHWNINSSGQLLTVEASAAGINADTTYLKAWLSSIAPPVYTAVNTLSSSEPNHRRRIFSVPLTSDGAGAVAATTIVPALAGYTGHAKLIGVWCAATDAATTFTLSVAAGTILGPAVHVMATTANAVTQFGAAAAAQTGCPVYIRGTLAADDNKDLQVAVTGYAATQTLEIFGEYWYET